MACYRLNTLEYPILLWLNMLDCMAFDVWVKLCSVIAVERIISLPTSQIHRKLTKIATMITFCSSDQKNKEIYKGETILEASCTVNQHNIAIIAVHMAAFVTIICPSDHGHYRSRFSKFPDCSLAQ